MSIKKDLETIKEYNENTVQVGKISPFQQVMYLYELALEFGVKGDDWGDLTYRIPYVKIIIPNNSLGFILKSKYVTLTINDKTSELFSYYIGTEEDLKKLYTKISTK